MGGFGSVCICGHSETFHLVEVCQIWGCDCMLLKLIKDEEYICPKCGRVCTSLSEFHLHYKKEHQL